MVVSGATRRKNVGGRANTTGDDDIRIERKHGGSGPVMQARRHGRSSTHSVERQVPHEEPCVARMERSRTSPSGNGAMTSSCIQLPITPAKGTTRKALGTPGSSRVLRSHTKAIEFANLESSQLKPNLMRNRAESVAEVEEKRGEGEELGTANADFSKSIFESEGFSMISASSLPTIHEGSNHADMYSPTIEHTETLPRSQSGQTQTPSIDPSPTIPPPPLPSISVQPNLMTAVSIPGKLSNQTEETPKMVRVVKAGMALRGVVSPDSQHPRPIVPKGNADENILPSIENPKVSDPAEQSGIGTKRNAKGGLIFGDQLSTISMEKGVEAVPSTPRDEDEVFRDNRDLSKSPTRKGKDGLELNMLVDRPVTYPELPLQTSPDQSSARSGKVISSVDAEPSVGISGMHVASMSRNTEDAGRSNQKVNEPSKLSITKELDSLLFPGSQSSFKGEVQEGQITETKKRSRPKKKPLDKDIWQLEAEVGRQPKRRAIDVKKQVRTASPRQGGDERGVRVEDGRDILQEPSNIGLEPSDAGALRREKIPQQAISSTENQLRVGSDFARNRQGDQFLEYSYSLKANATSNSLTGLLEQKDGNTTGNAVIQEQKGEEAHEALVIEEEHPAINMGDEGPIGLPTAKETASAEEMSTYTIQEEPPAPFFTDVSETQNIPPVQPLAQTQQPTNNTTKPKASKNHAITTSRTEIMPPSYKVRVPRFPSSFPNGRHCHYHHTHLISKSYRPSLKIYISHTGERIWTDGHYIHLKRLYKLTPPTTRATLFTPTSTTPKISPTPSISNTSTATWVKDSFLSWLFPASAAAAASKEEEGEVNHSSILHKLIALPKPVNRAFYIGNAEWESIRRYLEDARRANNAAAADALWDEEYVAGRLLRLRVGEERRGGMRRG